MAISYRAAQNLIKRGKEDELQAELSNGLNANLTNENGWTLLMLAAVEGSTAIGKLLLHYGADATMRNSTGKTAAEIALARGSEEFVAMLQEDTPQAS